MNQNIIIDNVIISRTNKTKFLGVIIDELLSFQQHIMYVKGKVARGLGILYKTKKYLHQKTLTQLYNAFIYPHLTYCIPVWGNACKTYLDPLVKIQKRVIRLIKGAKKLDHTDPLFKELKILMLLEIYVYILQFESNDSIHDIKIGRQFYCIYR